MFLRILIKEITTLKSVIYSLFYLRLWKVNFLRKNLNFVVDEGEGGFF